MSKLSNTRSAAKATEPNLARRSFVRDIGLAAALTGCAASTAVQAKAAPNPDAELLRLGDEFERLWEAERAAENPCHEAAFEAALDRVAAIVHRIMSIPAKTLDGFRVKARGVLWCHSGEPIADNAFSFYETPTTDYVLLAGIVRDLLAIERST